MTYMGSKNSTLTDHILGLEEQRENSEQRTEWDCVDGRKNTYEEGYL